MPSSIFKTSSTDVLIFKGAASEKHLKAALIWLHTTGLIFPSLSLKKNTCILCTTALHCNNRSYLEDLNTQIKHNKW